MTLEEKMIELNKLHDTYLEEVINAHPEMNEEDREAINKVLSYRKMAVPLKLTVKDHHYATVLRKTGSLPNEIMFNEKYVHIENITTEITFKKDLTMTWLVVLTRVEKCSKEIEKIMGKYKAIASMNLKEVYDHYLAGRNYMGILIYGGDEPYPVSIDRVKAILGIENQEESK